MAANIANYGGSCDSSGNVYASDGVQINNRPDVAAIIAAHDPWEYSISPQMPIVKVGGSATVQVTGAPGTTNLLIDGVAIEITVDVGGRAIIECEMLAIGNYVIRGVDGELANCAAVIMVVE